MCIGENRKYARVCRLVTQAFVPNPNNFPQVGHKDESKDNDNADNLEWVTPKQNSNMPLHKKRLSDALSGEKNPNYGKRGENNPNYGRIASDETRAKMSVKSKGRFTRKTHPASKRVICEGVIYDSIIDCAEHYNINPATIRVYLRGERPLSKKWADRGLSLYND